MVGCSSLLGKDALCREEDPLEAEASSPGLHSLLGNKGTDGSSSLFILMREYRLNEKDARVEDARFLANLRYLRCVISP